MSTVSTLFVVRDNEEYCILFDPRDPVGLYEILFEHAARSDLGITRTEILEVIEGMVPDRLRAI
jgi:hypothetical protein